MVLVTGLCLLPSGPHRLSVNAAADPLVTLRQDPDEVLVNVKLRPQPYTDSVYRNVFIVELVDLDQGVVEVPLLKICICVGGDLGRALPLPPSLVTGATSIADVDDTATVLRGPVDALEHWYVTLY